MALQLDSVTRRFGSQKALDAVSLHVRRGDCYGFIGHNGAGKTTAMRIALGLQRASEGSVRIDGLDARRHPREVRARTGGLIEVPGFHGAQDAVRNLVWLGRLSGLSTGDARREAGRLLDLVGLEGVGNKPVRAFSHGMRQRLGIAQALLGSPSVVLLDEPTNGLDPEGIAEMRTILRRLIDDEGLTVMLSSHQLHEVADLCNRIGVLRQGRLVAEAETRELLQGADGKYQLATDDDAAAAELLRRLGVACEPRRGAGGLDLELGERRPAEVARAVVERGLALDRFAPAAPSLEAIYLRFTEDAPPERPAEARQAPPEAIAAPPEATAAPPSEPRAPSMPLLRVARYELARWTAGLRGPLLVAIPGAVALLAIWQRHRQLESDRARVESGELFSFTDVTAFEGVALALRAGLPLLGLILAGLASQAVASELGRGTLRNLLLRPVRRAHVAIGKGLALTVLGALAYGLLAAIAVVASQTAFEFRDLVEVLPNGETYPLPGFTAEELRPEMLRALRSPLAGLFACVGLGFLASSIARTGAGALALALGLVVGLDLARGLARGADVEHLLHTAYLPSPLGDTSFLKLYADLAQGVSNSTFEYASTALSVPLAWGLAGFALAALILARRSVP